MTPAPAARCPFETFHDYEPPKLTAKQKRENAERAGHARQTLEAYAEITDIGEDDETMLCDMLADMMHLLGREAVEGRMFMAAEHYEAERRGEE
jgi:methanogenic corrinoid protein MtbC1